MRVAIGGISHETSTFSLVPTTLSDFESRMYYSQTDLIPKLTGTKTAIGGFIDVARDLNFELIPTLMTSAVPGGIVTAEALSTLTDRLAYLIRQAHCQQPVDGILLSLHGAMVSELDDDGESYILRAIREVVGSELPIVVELDLHGNITPEMVGLASICVAYDEYPHTDPYERAYEAGILLAKLIRGGVKPTPAIVNIPLLCGMQRQYSHAEPMLTLKHQARDLEGEKGVLNVSYLPGFPYSDIAPASFSVIVTTDDDLDQARAGAQRLAAYVWEHREDFIAKPIPIDEAVQIAMGAAEGPIVMADTGDNPGAGTSADGTCLLEALLRLGATRAVLAPMRDPEVVQEAIQIGVGGQITTKLGGKVDARHGDPLPVSGRVVRIGDGQFTHTGPMLTGVEIKLGETVVLELDGYHGGKVQVIVTTNRYQPTDLEMLRSQGIEPTDQQIIAVKSLVHFRAAFTPIAKQILEVDTPGLSSPHLERLTFTQINRPIYPFDREMQWSPMPV